MEKEELLKVISRLLNVSVEKAKEIADGEDGEGKLIDLNKEIHKKKFDDGHKKATARGLKDFTDAIGSELDITVSGSTPEEILSSIKEGLSANGSAVTDDQIKGSDLFKELQSQLTKATQDQNKIVEKRVKEETRKQKETFESELKSAKRGALNSELYSKAEQWLTEKGAILHEDSAKRQKQIKELVNKLSDLDIDKDDDGFIFTKDGQAKTNKDGHNAKIDDVFGEYDYLFNFKTGQQRQSPGLDPNGHQQPGNNNFKHFKGDVPKTKEEMDKIHTDFIYGNIDKEAYQEVNTAYEAAAK
jgi:hypothetical protein